MEPLMQKASGKPYFNYVITVHNKQDLIEDVVTSVINCMSSTSRLYIVLDGCTDNSETIVDEITERTKKKEIFKIYENDVHELKAINSALRIAPQNGHGFNIILQDDVILNDFNIEKKIINLYSLFNNLGIVSFRHGANISRKLLFKKTNIFPIKNYIENVKGHIANFFYQLKLGSFTFREIAIKSPICIPTEVIRTIGLPDEAFAPWDDFAYCYRVTAGGYNNGVYGLDFTSEINWGTTRVKKQNVTAANVELNNIKLFKTLYLNDFDLQLRKVYSGKIYNVEKNNYRQKIEFIKILKDLKQVFVAQSKYAYRIMFYK